MSTRPVSALPSLPEVPDFLGRAARIDTVAAMLQEAQEQLQHYRAMMIVNGEQPTDHIQVRGGEAPTYAERIAQLEAGMSELWAAHWEIHKDLEAEAVRRQDQVQRRIQKARDDA